MIRSLTRGDVLTVKDLITLGSPFGSLCQLEGLCDLIVIDPMTAWDATG